MTPIASRCRFLLTGVATVAAVALLAAPATASVADNASGCAVQPVVQPFAPFSDSADYFLAPNGGLERGASGWTLDGHAAVTHGNEPFYVGGSGDHKSLRLPAGSSATTAPFCIGVEDRTMRFFANASASSALDVDVLYTDADGVSRELNVATLGGAGDWAATDVVPMVVNELAADRGNAIDVRLRFAPHGDGAWTIDDVYVDPFIRR
ncbi:MAG: hypothetical protein QOJ89_5114 [bacterium]